MMWSAWIGDLEDFNQTQSSPQIFFPQNWFCHFMPADMCVCVCVSDQFGFH